MKLHKDYLMCLRTGIRLDKQLYRDQQSGAWYLVGAVAMSCLMLAWAVIK